VRPSSTCHSPNHRQLDANFRKLPPPLYRVAVYEAPERHTDYYILKLVTKLTPDQADSLDPFTWVHRDDDGGGLVKYWPSEGQVLQVDDRGIIKVDDDGHPFNPIGLELDVVVTPYHELCMSHEMLRETFRCEKPKSPREGQNEVKYALDWVMGTPLGVWGGMQ
jgi:hypothetical protein